MENIPPWPPHPRARMRLLDHDPLNKYRLPYPGEEQEQDDDGSSGSSSSSYIGAPHPYSPISPSSPRSDPDQAHETSSEEEERVEDFDLDAPHGTFDPGYDYEPQTDEERALIEENDINPGVVLVSIECNEDVAAGRACLNTSCAIHYGRTGVDSDWDDENCHYEGMEWEDEDKEEVSGNDDVEANGVEQHELEENDLDENEIQQETVACHSAGRGSSKHYPGSDSIGDDDDEDDEENDCDEATSDDDSSGDNDDDEYPDIPRQIMDDVIEEGLISGSDSEGNAEESQGEDDDDRNHDDNGNDDGSPPRKKQKRVHSRGSEVEEQDDTRKYAPAQEENGEANKAKEEDDSGNDGEDGGNQDPGSATESDLEREVDLALLPEPEQQPE